MEHAPKSAGAQELECSWGAGGKEGGFLGQRELNWLGFYCGHWRNMGGVVMVSQGQQGSRIGRDAGFLKGRGGVESGSQLQMDGGKHAM